MSPEQARGQAVDARTDVWSLGVILYEMVARRLPFPGKTPTDRVAAILEREPEPLGRLRRSVLAELERVASRALAKDRDERYARVADMAEDLRKVRETLGAEPRFRFALPAPARGLLFSRKRRSVAVAALLLVITAALVAGLSYLFLKSSTREAQTEIKSLAVLPLKSLNREAGDDYLGLGIADTIITKVSQVGGLTVRPTSAVRKYADQEIDSLEAGRQLQADAILDGTFLHAGDRLRVSVNLLRVRDGASLWAESFDMRFTDIFAIQDEVSKKVAARLRLRLSPAEQARLAKRHTTNPEAYSYYTKAMYHFSKRGFIRYPQKKQRPRLICLRKRLRLTRTMRWLMPSSDLRTHAWIAELQGRRSGPDSESPKKSFGWRSDSIHNWLTSMSRVLSSPGAITKIGRLRRRSAKRVWRNSSTRALPIMYWQRLYYHVGLEELSAKEFELGAGRRSHKRYCQTRLSLHVFFLSQAG